VFAELFEERGQRRSLGGGQWFEYRLQLARMRVKNAPDQRSAGCGKRHVGHAPIVWASLPANISFFLEAIDSGGDRSAGEQDVSSDRIDWERAFMQKDFQDSKVRDAEPGRGDTAGIDLSERAVSLHQNEPEMDAGSVSLAGLRIVHGIIFISRYFARKFFFVAGG
jgi:hypothetical protein